MYTLISMAIVSKAIDYFQDGYTKAKGITIISSKSEEIKERIMNETGRGTTIIKGEGGFTGNEMDLLFCVVSKFEVTKVKTIVKETDSFAFLFCCFTSLRYSDVRNLKRSDVKSDHIEVTTVKTADSLNIELNKYSKAILEKYKDIHFENNMALPVISNQKMNDYLKELGELAEINEPVRETYYKGNERIDEVTPKYALLSTHAGRRTFICNALALGIPAQVVMKWTGHSDYKAMKPYIDIADDIKANAMNKFNQL